MTDSQRDGKLTFMGSFEPLAAQICPPAPSHDLTAWLVRIMLEDAPTIRLPGFEVPRVQPSRLTEELELVARDPGRQAPRAGIPVWSVEAAYLRDIEALSSLQNAERLDLRDYRDHDERGRSGSADRYVRRGRCLLAQMGAWPWAVALPLARNWWTCGEYLTPLATWHRDAWLSAYESLAWRAGGLVDGHHWGTPGAHQRAAGAYATEIGAARDARREAA